MNLDNFKETWKKEDEIVNSSITINSSEFSSIRAENQVKQFQSMKWARVVEGIVFFIIIVSLWKYIVADFALSATTISAFVLNVFAIIGLAGNIGQIALISQIDFSQPVKELQGKIYAISSHKLQLTKLLILSTSFYMAYVLFGFDVLWGVDLYQHLSSGVITAYVISSAALFVFSAWFVSKLSYKNIQTPWVKSVIGFLIGERLVGMAEFLKEAETTV